MPGNRLKSAAQINWLRRQTSSQFSSETKMRSRIFAIPSYPTLTPALAPTFPHPCGTEGCGSLIAHTGKSHVQASPHIKTPAPPCASPVHTTTRQPAAGQARKSPHDTHFSARPTVSPKPSQTAPADLSRTDTFDTWRTESPKILWKSASAQHHSVTQPEAARKSRKHPRTTREPPAKFRLSTHEKPCINPGRRCTVTGTRAGEAARPSARSTPSQYPRQYARGIRPEQSKMPPSRCSNNRIP